MSIYWFDYELQIKKLWSSNTTTLLFLVIVKSVVSLVRLEPTTLWSLVLQSNHWTTLRYNWHCLWYCHSLLVTVPHLTFLFQCILNYPTTYLESDWVSRDNVILNKEWLYQHWYILSITKIVMTTLQTIMLRYGKICSNTM